MYIPITFYDDNWKPDPAGLNFHGTIPVENGGDSVVVQSCYLRWSGMWGSDWTCGTFRGAALTADGIGIDDTRWTTLNPGPGGDFWTIPDGDGQGRPCRVVYVEGRRQNSATAVTALVLPLAK